MERALLVEVTTYGFLHAGMAQLRREALKRSWPFLPGGTLYGALRAGLIRLDGLSGAGPQAMLDDLVGGRLRFTPLLPDRDGSIAGAAAYCRQAQRLADSESGRSTNDPPLSYQTTPHAPLSRRQEQIEGSLLYAIESHQSEQRYRGWIFTTAGCEPHLRRAMGILPFLPLGGKGKYTAAEIKVAAVATRAAIEAEMAQMAAGAEVTIELVSPMVIEGCDVGLLRDATRLYPKPPRHYQVWRTGIYPDLRETTKEHTYAGSEGKSDSELNWGRDDQNRGDQNRSEFYVGQGSCSVAGLPEGSSFVLPAHQGPAIAGAFVAGLGRTDWTGLGWGQFFVRESATAREVAHA